MRKPGGILLKRRRVLLLLFIWILLLPGCRNAKKDILSPSEWVPLPIELKEAGPVLIEKLVTDTGAKIRLLNVWATWCAPCRREFPEFIRLQRKYGSGYFEFVSLSVDRLHKKEQALEFLKKTNAAVPNYIAKVPSENTLIELLDPEWKGALPFTLLIAPNGEILYRQQGEADIRILENLIRSQPIMQKNAGEK